MGVRPPLTLCGVKNVLSPKQTASRNGGDDGKEKALKSEDVKTIRCSSSGVNTCF